MNNSIHRIWLDINETNSQATISCRQGDLARSIYCTLTENGKPYVINTDCYAIFSAKKADETVLFNDCVIQENVIKYDFTPQTTSALGMMNCEIQLFNSEGRLITSPAFNLFVYNKVVEDESILSKDEANTLTNLLADGKSFIEEVETKLENGEFIGEPGQKGDAFTYDDFTEEQLAQLKGEKGEPGSFTAGDGILVDGDVISTDKSKINRLIPYLEYAIITNAYSPDVIELAITSCETSAKGNIIIPDMIDGYPVVSINGFGYCQMESVVIPDKVRAISEACFSDCPNLKTITIPKSVTKIEDYAFAGCVKLTDVYFSGSATDWKAITIGTDNEKLKNATIHYGEQKITAGNGLNIDDDAISLNLDTVNNTLVNFRVGDKTELRVNTNVIATKDDLVGKVDKTYVDGLMTGAVKRAKPTSLDVVTNPDANTIYMIPSTNSQEQNVYEEYMFIDNKWELIGSTAIDLSGYVTKATFDSLHLTDRIIPVGMPIKDTVAKTLTFQNFYLNGIYYRVQNPVVNYSEMGNKILVVVELEELSEQIGNATLTFNEYDFFAADTMDLIENGSKSIYGYYKYIAPEDENNEDMFSYYFSSNTIFTYGLGDFEIRLKEKIDGEYAKLTDLELHDLPRNIRIASYDGANTVKVAFDFKNTSATVEFKIITNVDIIGKAYLNKFKISDGNYGYLSTFNDETNPMSIHKTFAFDYIVENGVVTYLSTDGVNYLIEEQKADKEGNYEVAYETTLTEASQGIVVDNLNLKKAIIYISTPEATGTAALYVRLNHTDFNNAQQVAFCSEAIKTTAQLTKICIEKANGEISAEFATSTAESKLAYKRIYTNETTGSYVTSKNIEIIHLSGTSSTHIMPVGTTIKIKGVQA